eukprot:11835122-Alexandrium_andersonii.AAC.1
MVDDQLVEGARARHMRVTYMHPNRGLVNRAPFIVDDRLIEGSRVSSNMVRPFLQTRMSQTSQSFSRTCQLHYVCGYVLHAGFLEDPTALKAVTSHLETAQLVAELLTQPSDPSGGAERAGTQDQAENTGLDDDVVLVAPQ